MADLLIKVKVDDEEAQRKLANLYATAKNNVVTVTKEQLKASLDNEKQMQAESKTLEALSKATKAATDAKLSAARLAQVTLKQEKTATEESKKATEELTRARKADAQQVAENQRRLAQATRDAEREYEKMTGAAEKSFKAQGDAFLKAQKQTQGSNILPRTFAGFTTGGLVQAGLAATGWNGISTVAQAGIEFIKQSKDAYRDYIEYVNRSQVVFKDATKSVMDWSKTSVDSLNLSSTAALKAVGGFGTLFNELGLGDKKTAEMSQRMVTLAADMASFNHRSLDETMEALMSGLNGMERPLRSFGVNIDEAKLKQRAFQDGLIKSTKEVLPPEIKVMAAYNEILEQTKIQQGDLARTADSAANQERNLNAQMEELHKNIGEEWLPIWKEWLTVVRDLTKGLKDLPGAWSGNTWQSMREREESLNQKPTKADLGEVKAKEARRALLLARYQYNEQTHGALIEPKNAEEVEFLKSAGISFDAQGRANPGTNVNNALMSTFKAIGSAQRMSDKIKPEKTVAPIPSWRIREDLQQSDKDDITTAKKAKAAIAAIKSANDTEDLVKLKGRAHALINQLPPEMQGELNEKLEEAVASKSEKLTDEANKDAETVKNAQIAAAKARIEKDKAYYEGILKQGFNPRALGFIRRDELALANIQYSETTAPDTIGQKDDPKIAAAKKQQADAEFADAKQKADNAYNEGIAKGDKDFSKKQEEKYEKYVEAGKQDSEEMAKLREQGDVDRLKSYDEAYSYFIKYLEDEQQNLSDALQKALDTNDPEAASRANKALFDSRARQAQFEYSRELASRTPFDETDMAIQSGILPADYAEQEFSRKINQANKDTSPIDDQIRVMRQTQDIIASMMADEEKNRNNIKIGGIVGAAGAQTAEAVGAAIAAGIESHNGKAAMRGLGNQLSQEFVQAMTRETVIRPLTRVFARLGDEIAAGGLKAGAAIYQAVGAAAGLLQVSQRKKKTGFLSVIGGFAGFVATGGNPAGAIAGYNIGNALDNSDYIGAGIGVATAGASGAFNTGGGGGTSGGSDAPGLGSGAYGGGFGGRSVQINNHYGVVNDRADANRIVQQQTNQLYKAVSVGG